MNRRRFLSALAATPVAVAMVPLVGKTSPARVWTSPVYGMSGRAIAPLRAPAPLYYWDVWIAARVEDALNALYPSEGWVETPDGLARYHVVDRLPFALRDSTVI